LHRVREASEELAALSDLHSLDKCIPGLSPKWLQSLILDAPDNSSTECLGRALDMLEKDPEKCLSLLQV